MIPPWLHRLMECPRHVRGARGSENELSIAFANMMRAYTREGRYNGIWLHPANEGKRTAHTGLMLKAMGLIPGTADYVLIWPAPDSLEAGCLELKMGRNGLTEAQEHFRLWCQRAGVNHAVARSLPECEAVLKAWRAIP